MTIRYMGYMDILHIAHISFFRQLVLLQHPVQTLIQDLKHEVVLASQEELLDLFMISACSLVTNAVKNSSSISLGSFVIGTVVTSYDTLRDFIKNSRPF